MKADDGTELLSGPIGLVAISDTSDTWAHGINQFRQEIGRPALVSSSVVENGPVTRVTRHRARWQESEIVLDIAQFAGLDFLELRFVIDWREREQMLKLEIPTALAHPRIFAKVPGQILERHANGEEEPYQDWAAVQGRIGEADYTVALLKIRPTATTASTGSSAPCSSGQLRLRVTIPDSVPHNDNNAWQDQGRQERTFWLTAGRGAHTEFALDRRAEELQTPAEYVVDSAHSGTEPWEKSFLEITPRNVWVLAIKQAEQVPGAKIIRIQERSGTATQAKLKSTALGLDHTVALAPWELKTLLIKPAKNGASRITETSLLEI